MRARAASHLRRRPTPWFRSSLVLGAGGLLLAVLTTVGVVLVVMGHKDNGGSSGSAPAPAQPFAVQPSGPQQPPSPPPAPQPRAASLLDYKGTRCIALAPDGKTLATGGFEDGALRLWDVGSRREHVILESRVRNVGSVSFSPNGQLLASTSGQTFSGATSAKLWDVATKTMLYSHDSDKEIGYLAFTRDGKRVALAMGHAVGLWDTATGQVKIVTSEGGPVAGLACSPTDETLVVTRRIRDAENLELYDLVTGALKRKLASPFPHPGPVAFSPDGTLLAVGTFASGGILWETASWQMLAQRLRSERGYFTQLVFMPDGKTLIGLCKGGRDGVEFWDVDAGKVRFALDERFWCMALSWDGQLLVTGSQVGPIKLWDAATGQQRSQ